MHDKNVIKLTEQEAVLLEQAASMLEGLENDERNRGNCSTAEGAGCSAHAVRRLASALLAHEREIGQCLHQIAEPAHPTACTVEEVRAFEAAAAPAAVAVPDSSDLGFAVEQRGDVWVVVEDAGGVCPASSHECALWNALIEARAALAAAPAAAETVPQGVLDAVRCAGMQLLRTTDGYQLEKLRRIEASSTAAPAAPAPTAREDFAWLVVQEACETEPADEDDPECIRVLRRDLKTAVLAAFLRDAVHTAPAADALDAVTVPVSALRDLRKGHIYMGLCPEDSQPDSRDDECPCCKATLIVDAAIAAQAAAKEGTQKS